MQEIKEGLLEGTTYRIIDQCIEKCWCMNQLRSLFCEYNETLLRQLISSRCKGVGKSHVVLGYSFSFEILAFLLFYSFHFSFSYYYLVLVVFMINIYIFANWLD